LEELHKKAQISLKPLSFELDGLKFMSSLVPGTPPALKYSADKYLFDSF